MISKLQNLIKSSQGAKISKNRAIRIYPQNYSFHTKFNEESKNHDIETAKISLRAP